MIAATASRHRVAFADAILLVCVFVFGGLLVLGGVVMLLSWVTAARPTSTFNSRPQFDVYSALRVTGMNCGSTILVSRA